MDHREGNHRRADTPVARARLCHLRLALPSPLDLVDVPLPQFQAATAALASSVFLATPLLDEGRLRQTLTVRVSQTPLSDLPQRLGAALDVRLLPEGEVRKDAL
jgi:hypothetical protein